MHFEDGANRIPVRFDVGCCEKETEDGAKEIKSKFDHFIGKMKNLESNTPNLKRTKHHFWILKMH